MDEVQVFPTPNPLPAGGVYGWHFLPDDGCLAHTEPPIAVEAGCTYQVSGMIVPCTRGLHGCERVLDTLRYAAGTRLCRTYHSGRIVWEQNKLASRARAVLWMADATRVLHEFALWCAEQTLALVPEPHPRLLQLLALKRAWLDGCVADDDLAATRGAVRAACRGSIWGDPQAALFHAYVIDAVYWAASLYASNAACNAFGYGEYTVTYTRASQELERRCLALAPEGVL